MYPIWWTMDSMPGLEELIALKKNVIGAAPIMVLGGTACEVGDSGGLRCKAREFYSQGQARASEGEPLTQC